MSVWTTWLERQDQWLLSLMEHIQISLVSLYIAMIIAVPLGIFLSQYRRGSELSLQLAGILQTIPSLALLGIFIPLMGIGRLPAVVALVIYGIFPILQATLVGLKEIDPSLQEAARAFGMNKWEKLKKFEIALATPVIVSGIRTSAVMIIGTATLAALIGAGGLGSFILLGIDRNHMELILIGAISSALLAIVFSYGIGLLERVRLRGVVVSLSVLGLLLLASFIPWGGGGQRELVVAGKLGVEPEILIHMYEALIEEKTDYDVTTESNFGKTGFLYEALKRGDVDIYPEFSGTILGSLLENPPEASNDPREVYELARDGILAQDELAFLEPMAFQNTYALAVPRSLAEEKGLETISDLKKVEDEIVAGFTLEFADREDGNRGLKSLYDLHLEVKTMEPALRYRALEEGEVHVVDAYSTDSDIRRYDLVLLEDDLQLFPPYQGAPLLREELAQESPQLVEALEALAGKITEEQMQSMNYRVEVEGEDAREVAREYLLEEGLITE
ncbi:MAG: ABC transporter permease/substrate-binding protein [Tissierellia bacterium]|nr:ABC transporter permease/substrate-binding protein [Tissierellia bacterium]